MSELAKKFIFFTGIILPAIIWAFVSVDGTMPFEFDVPQLITFDFLEHKWLYAGLHVFVFVPVFLLSFDKKVAFYKSWKYLFPAIIIVAAFFILWDALFTTWNVWGFNSDYFIGLEIFGLPIEEWLFFFSVPFSSIFIYACLNAYFPKDHFNKWDQSISIFGGLALISIGVFYFDRIYTSTTFLMTGIALLLHYALFENTYRTKFYRAYLLTWVPFLIVDGLLTGTFTDAPTVLYNPEEFLGLRIGAVPVEDSIYGLLLLLMVCSLMHWLGAKKPVNTGGL